MNTIQIKLDSKDENIFSYTVCGQLVLINQKLNSLSAFSSNETNNPTLLFAQHLIKGKERKVIFKGKSWLAEKDREITCSEFSNGYLISVPEISEFFVSNDGSKIFQQPFNESVLQYPTSFQQLEQTLLGPPLMLSLALNQLFSLHSSSVLIGKKAVLFAGNSGFGKSTMSRYLQQDGDLKRFTDDISVLSKIDNNFILHADFPQMKLPDSSQNARFAKTELGAIVLLSRQPHTDEINLVKLNSFDAIEVLLSHGVAAQLFDKTLAYQHLKFMSELAGNVPIYRLDYPNGLEKINTIAKILKREFD